MATGNPLFNLSFIRKEAQGYMIPSYTTNPRGVSAHHKTGNAISPAIAELHAPTANAMRRYSRQQPGIDENDLAAAHMMVGIYIMERDLGNGKRVAGMYHPGTGDMRLSVFKESGGRYKKESSYVLAQNQNKFDGEDAMLLFGLFQIDHDDEFAETYKSLAEKADKPDTEVANELYRLSDNMFIRLAVDKLIPFDESSISGGTFPGLKRDDIEHLIPAPDEIFVGEFKVFKKASIKKVKSFKNAEELKAEYDTGLEVAEEFKDRIPKPVKGYIPSEEIVRTLRRYKEGGKRQFMFRGSAGCGKTTDVYMMAYALGLPYLHVDCSDGTQEEDLLTMVQPNTGEKRYRKPSRRLTPFDVKINPEGVIKEYTGSIVENATEEDAWQVVLDCAAGGDDSSAFKSVESQLVKACRMPCVLEIQEPTTISRPGVLSRLNALFDDRGEITLMDGSVMRVHPETVFVLTTNVGYAGCRDMNQAFTDRFLTICYPEPTAKTLRDRYASSRGITAKEDLENLYPLFACVIRLQEYCRENMIESSGAVARRAYDWADDFRIFGYAGMKDSVMDCVLSQISADAEIREELYTNVVAACMPRYNDDGFDD